VPGIPQPQLVLEQRAELRGQVAHLGRELHLLFALEGDGVGERGVHHDQCLGSHRSVLGSPEAQHVDVGSQVGQRAAEERRGVGQAGTVHVDEQPVVPAELAEPPQFVQGVAGAHLSGLGDGDRPGLDPVLVPATAQAGGDQFRRELAVGGGHGQQLAAGDPLRGPALVHVEVGALGADDGLVRAQHEAEAEDIGPRAVEDEVDPAAGTERAGQLSGGPGRPGIIPVRGGITVARRGQGGQDRRMGARVVVAAEALAGCHSPSLVQRAAPPASAQ
jgi:hypothetical protein